MSTGMVFDIYRIKSPNLTPYIQYILFNYSDGCCGSHLVTSFANTNICLGIVKGKELVNRQDSIKCMRPKQGVNAYLSGMYLSPHRFEAEGALDEICIDFTPQGYYHFFGFPAQTYIFNEDILTEGFGKEARNFFATVFEKSSFRQRGQMIEQFLQKRFIDTGKAFAEQCLYYIHRAGGNITLRALAASLQCSEKKIVRTFLSNFDLTPKDYMRIMRFRKTLAELNRDYHHNLTCICYENDYYDQSHFIKDFRFFTGETPGRIKDNLHDVKQHVIIGLD